MMDRWTGHLGLGGHYRIGWFDYEITAQGIGTGFRHMDTGNIFQVENFWDQ